MSSSTIRQRYSIREAAALTGLPASTLRYYESIGIIEPIGRDESSGHRVYTPQDLDVLTAVACLSATGMSVADMRHYIANNRVGPEAAGQQIELLRAQGEQLAAEARQLEVRRRYVALKIEYWEAVAAQDLERAKSIGLEAIEMAAELTKSTKG
ncbi:MerR family transcriptional regulator [Glutamicibacter sp. X7]